MTTKTDGVVVIETGEYYADDIEGDYKTDDTEEIYNTEEEA